MAEILCRMCGEELSFAEGAATATCRRCGFRQARPKARAEEALNRFAEAGKRFIQGDYDAAGELYTRLEAEYPEEAEAVWGKMLCQRGVEYAEAPFGYKLTPFCHALDARSVLEDPEFDRVLELADGEVRTAYQEEGALIEEAFRGAAARLEAEMLSKGVRMLEGGQWKKAETLFLRVLNQNRASAEAYLGLALAQNRYTTLNEYLRGIHSRFQEGEATVETVPAQTERIREIVNRCAVPGYLAESELRKLLDYPLTYESRVEAVTEARQKALQALDTEPILQKAIECASGAFQQQIQETVQAFRNMLQELSLAAEEERVQAAETLEDSYAQYLDEAERKADELSAAARERQEADYRALCRRQKKAHTKDELEALIEAFAAMNGYKQSDNRLLLCRKRLAHPLQMKLSVQRKTLTCVGAAVLILIAVIAFRPMIESAIRYQSAKRLFEAGNYAEALNAFSTQSGYRDSDEWAEKCVDILNQKTAETQPKEEQPSEPAPSEPPQDQLYENGAFFLSAPPEWAEKVDVLSDIDHLHFYEKSNRNGAGGFLFSLTLLDRDGLLECVDWPETTLLGKLTRDEEERFLILRRPSDVQFGGAEAKAYQEAADMVDSVVATLTVQNGYLFTPASQVKPESEQVIRVNCAGSSAAVDLLSWTDNGWTEIFHTSAAIGSNGLTEQKQEGDRCTPAGVFAVRFCLGIEEPETKLDFRAVTEGDVWVCDPESPYYNTLQKEGSGDWSRSEDIYRQFSSGRSVVCIFLDYNGDGLTAGSAASGSGSTIFLDGVGPMGELDSGYGDIKMNGEEALALLRVLDPARNPTIVIRNAP